MPTTWSLSLDRLWKLHTEVEEQITRFALREILDLITAAAPNTVTSVELLWEESPTWMVTYDDDDRGIHTVEAYDLGTGVTGLALKGPELSDALWQATPSFWEWMTHRLIPYTETAYVEVDKHFGMLEGAIFTPERILHPHTPEEVSRLQDEREARHTAELVARRERQLTEENA
jgi:hypothetical protein